MSYKIAPGGGGGGGGGITVFEHTELSWVDEDTFILTHDAVPLANTERLRFKAYAVIAAAPGTTSTRYPTETSDNLLPSGTQYVTTSGGGVLGKFTANPPDMTTVRDRLVLRTVVSGSWSATVIEAFHGSDLTVDNSVELTDARASMTTEEAKLTAWQDGSNPIYMNARYYGNYYYPSGAWYLGRTNFGLSPLEIGTLTSIETYDNDFSWGSQYVGDVTILDVVAGDIFTVGGVDFTAVAGGAVAANQEFNDVASSGNRDNTTTSLAATINNAASQALIGHSVTAYPNWNYMLLVDYTAPYGLSLAEDTAAARIVLPFNVSTYAMRPTQVKVAVSWDGVTYYYYNGANWLTMDPTDQTEWDTKGCFVDDSGYYSYKALLDTSKVALDAAAWTAFNVLKPATPGNLILVYAGTAGLGFPRFSEVRATFDLNEYLQILDAASYFDSHHSNWRGVEVTRISTTEALFQNRTGSTIDEFHGIVEVYSV